MKTIKLPCFGIIIEVNKKGGSIRSDLLNGLTNNDTEVLHALNGIESLILAHACAGINVAASAYIEGIEVAVLKVYNAI